MIRLLDQGYALAGCLSSEYFQGKSSACLCFPPALTNWHLNIAESQKLGLKRISRSSQPRLRAPGDSEGTASLVTCSALHRVPSDDVSPKGTSSATTCGCGTLREAVNKESRFGPRTVHMCLLETQDLRLRSQLLIPASLVRHTLSNHSKRKVNQRLNPACWQKFVSHRTAVSNSIQISGTFLGTNTSPPPHPGACCCFLSP